MELVTYTQSAPRHGGSFLTVQEIFSTVKVDQTTNIHHEGVDLCSLSWNIIRRHTTSFFPGSRARNELSPIEKVPKAPNAGSEGAQKTTLFCKPRIILIEHLWLKLMIFVIWSSTGQVYVRQPFSYQKIMLGLKKSQTYIRKKNASSVSRRTYLSFT